MWSYCCQTHWRLQRFGERDGKFQQFVRSRSLAVEERFDRRVVAAIEES